MGASKASVGPIKVGVITDQTGPLSFMGIANANVAKMVIDDINEKGGLLGRQIDLIVEDSATTDSVGEAKATKLVQEDQVDVIFGGIYSSMRQAIKGPAVVSGKKLYIYPEQYEGQECDPLIFCTGPVPAQQVEPLIPWLMEQTGAKKFYFPSADYIWPHTLNEKVRQVATASSGEIVGEEYFPLDHTDYGETIDKITSTGAEVVFNTIVPPGLTPFLELLCLSFPHDIPGDGQHDQDGNDQNHDYSGVHVCPPLVLRKTRPRSSRPVPDLGGLETGPS